MTLLSRNGPSPTPTTAELQAPLVQRAASTVVPPTWCVVECCQGCRETWTVDVADFEPRLTASDVERLLTPLLLDHEQAHQGVAMTEPATAATKAKPREWFIEVCKTCGRHAIWPFCEHRRVVFTDCDARWTETVVVREVGRGR